MGEGTGKGRRIAHALGASVQQRELGWWRPRGHDGESWTTGTAPQWGRQTGWRHLRMARQGRAFIARKQKAASFLASGATVAGCVCAVTASATVWAHGETITDHQKWRRES